MAQIKGQNRNSVSKVGMHAKVLGVFFVTTILAASFARAQSQLPSETSVVPSMDFTLAADLGGTVYVNSSGAQGGPLAGATALYGAGSIGFGLLALRDIGLYSSRASSQYALLSGYSRRFDSGFRMDLLGSLAWHAYSGWGSPVASNFVWAGSLAMTTISGASMP